MLNPARNKGYFFDISDTNLIAARVSSFNTPLVIEAVGECSLYDPEETLRFIESFSYAKSDSKYPKYVKSHCGVYPNGYFIHRMTLESGSKAVDSAFLIESLKKKFNVETSENAVSVINAVDGSLPTREREDQTEILFCGAPKAELSKMQNSLLEKVIYPQYMGIGSLSTIGGHIHYLKTKGISGNILILSLGMRHSQVFIVDAKGLNVSRSISFSYTSMMETLKKELKLEDNELVRKKFLTEDFDKEVLGPKLVSKLIQDVQTSIGFYEVQTGSAIEKIQININPCSFSWITKILSEQLDIEVFDPEYTSWLQALNIQIAPSVNINELDRHWFGLFSLIGNL